MLTHDHAHDDAIMMLVDISDYSHAGRPWFENWLMPSSTWI
jgi:hypothetical protein